jgi:uncharacterized protein YceK
MKKFLKMLMVSMVGLSLSFLATGCASIFSGTNQTRTVTSYPPGVVVKEDGKTLGVTPVDLKLKRGDDHVLTYELPGYETVTCKTQTTFNPVSLLNFFNYFIGVLVDWPTGALYNIEPIPTMFMKKLDNNSVTPTTPTVGPLTTPKP